MILSYNKIWNRELLICPLSSYLVACSYKCGRALKCQGIWNFQIPDANLFDQISKCSNESGRRFVVPTDFFFSFSIYALISNDCAKPWRYVDKCHLVLPYNELASSVRGKGVNRTLQFCGMVIISTRLLWENHQQVFQKFETAVLCDARKGRRTAGIAVSRSAGKSKVRKSLVFRAKDYRFYPTGKRATLELFRGM